MKKNNSKPVQLVVLKDNTCKGVVILHSNTDIETLRRCGHKGECLTECTPDQLFYYEWGSEKQGHVSIGTHTESGEAITLGTTMREAVTKYGIQFNNPHA